MRGVGKNGRCTGKRVLQNADGEADKPLKKYITIVGQEGGIFRWKCNFGCRPEPFVSAGYNRVRSHFIGQYPGERYVLKLCPNVSQETREAMRAEEAAASEKLAKKKRNSDQQLVPNSPLGGSEIKLDIEEFEKQLVRNSAPGGSKSRLENSDTDEDLLVNLSNTHKSETLFDPLSKLIDPLQLPKHEDIDMDEECDLALVNNVKSVLVRKLESSLDPDKMVDVANRYLKFLGTCADYLQFYEAVRAVISHQYAQVAAEESRNFSASKVMNLETRCNEVESRRKKCGEDLFWSEAKELKVDRDIDPLRKQIEDAKRQLSELEKLLAEGESKVEDCRAEKISFSEAYSSLEKELNGLKREADRARAEVEETRKQKERAGAEVQKAMDKLKSLIS